MLQFDEATTRLLDNAYQGADISRRRRTSFDALSPKSGDRILDLGCGNGLFTLELARAVGADGQVTGLDASADMLSSARNRCKDFDTVDLVEGKADDMPFIDAQFDKAASIQVFEYLDDLRPPLKELHRVLRPNGRLVIGDIHWDSLCWHSDHPGRMTRMIELWDGHLADRTVPAKLPSCMRECGFTVEHVTPVTICDTSLRPDGLALMLIRLIEAYASQHSETSEDVARAWAHEQNSLAEQGRFFFSITHFVWVARKA